MTGTVLGQATSQDDTTPLVAMQPAPPTLFTPRQVSVSTPGFWSWALLDRRTGQITGPSTISQTTSTESMIKAWIASDYLRLTDSSGRVPSDADLAELSEMIRDSNDQDAEDIYLRDGNDAVIRRLISMCGLTDTSIVHGWWSKTQMSARDAVRMGKCIGDGRAAGPRWTPWILSEMRQVRGTVAEQPNGGRWGIIDALPPDVARTVAIKNGWTLLWEDGNWHVTCLAIMDDWVLSVMTRYPSSLGLSHGVGICKSVTQQLLSTSA
ncbi:MAG TPA: hypothetical protein VF054_10225 [Micromonosporaceae bacterium]